MAPAKSKSVNKKKVLVPPSKTLLDCSFKQLSAPRRVLSILSPIEEKYHDPNPYFIKNGGLALKFTDETGKVSFIPSTGCDKLDRSGRWVGPG